MAPGWLSIESDACSRTGSAFDTTVIPSTLGDVFNVELENMVGGSS